MIEVQGIGVSGILIVSGKALIIRRSLDDSEPGFWEFAKGAVDFGEDPKEAVVREYFEETNLKVRITKIRDVFSWSYKRDDRQYHIAETVFEVKLDDGETIANLKLSQDHIDSKLVDAGELKSLEPMVESRRNLLLKCLED